MIRNYYKKPIGYLFYTSFLFGTPVAHVAAQSSSLMLEEVVVTANKREQNLQDVGLSVTAFNGNQLKELGYSEPVDIVAQTPGVEMASFHQSYASFNIRGVNQNDFADHLEPPIALYQDNAYIPHQGAARAQMFDVERVEILRGPQGTLFGRNATGGLVHVLSSRPTKEFSGYLDFTAAEYNLFKIEGAVSGSLTDALSARIAFVKNESDGWFENRSGEDLNNQNNYAVRTMFEWDVTDDTMLGLKIHGANNEDESGYAYSHTPTKVGPDGLGVQVGEDEIASYPNILGGDDIVAECPGCDILGFNEPDNDSRTGSSQFGDFHRDIHGATFNLGMSFDNFNLTAITDYLVVDKFMAGDTDGTDREFFLYTTDQHSTSFAQEIRLDGGGSDFRWQTGAYYLTMDSDYLARVDLDVSVYTGGSEPNILQSITDYAIKMDTWAVFGQLEKDITDSLTLTAGLRYTEDDKEIDAVFSDLTVAFGLTSPTYFNKDLYPSLAQKNFQNYSGRLQLDWRPNDEWLYYASYNRGHKSGNWAMPVFGLEADPTAREEVNYPSLPHDEEVLESYEVGAKGSFHDGLAVFNASVFYYDYTDYQVFSLRNASQILFNRDATVSGGELELKLNPMTGLDVVFGASSIWEKTVENVPLPTGSGDRDLPQSPDFTFNTLIRYEWPVFDGAMAVQTDYSWTDDFFFYAINEPVTHQDSYGVANARVSYTSGDESWQVALWAKNVLDEEYSAFRLDVSSLAICSCAPAAPRWIGATASYRW